MVSTTANTFGTHRSRLKPLSGFITNVQNPVPFVVSSLSESAPFSLISSLSKSKSGFKIEGILSLIELYFTLPSEFNSVAIGF